MQDLKRKNQKRLTTTTILKPGLSPKFFLNLLKEISPIVAIDDTQTILFANESFQKEFAGSSRSLIGKNLFRILNLNPVDHEEMKSNINLSKWGKIQNQEFRKQKIYYGYSVFRFGDHIGIILKNITENKRLERKSQVFIPNFYNPKKKKELDFPENCTTESVKPFSQQNSISKHTIEILKFTVRSSIRDFF